MSGGIQRVQGQRGGSLVLSAAGGEGTCHPGTARGHSSSTPADYFGLCRALAERSAPLTDEERAAFNAMRAREMAKAEARRAAPSPQLPLDIAA